MNSIINSVAAKQVIVRIINEFFDSSPKWWELNEPLFLLDNVSFFLILSWSSYSSVDKTMYDIQLKKLYVRVYVHASIDVSHARSCCFLLQLLLLYWLLSVLVCYSVLCGSRLTFTVWTLDISIITCSVTCIWSHTHVPLHHINYGHRFSDSLIFDARSWLMPDESFH
jgi:hypothetical protein